MQVKRQHGEEAHRDGQIAGPVIAAIVLGPKQLPELGHSLGQSVGGFKDSLEGEEKRRD
jgi:TatA/E family protein of Tat protein translocase